MEGTNLILAVILLHSQAKSKVVLVFNARASSAGGGSGEPLDLEPKDALEIWSSSTAARLPLDKWLYFSASGCFSYLSAGNQRPPPSHCCETPIRLCT